MVTLAIRDINSWEIAFLGQETIPRSQSTLLITPEYVPFTNVTGVGLPAGARREGGDRWPVTDAVPGRC